MAFDVCIGVSEAELNDGAVSIYQRLYPQVFTGTQHIDKGPVSFTASFDVKKPPVFDLAPVTARPDGPVTAAADTTSGFTVGFPDVVLTLSAPEVESVQLGCAFTVHCSVVSTGTTVAFVANSVTAAAQPDRFDDVIVERFVLPSILASARALFSGLTIPSFDLPGVSLGPPSAVITDRRLYAFAMLAGNGQPSFPGELDWPGSGFFTLLSRNALQAAASYAIAQSGELSGSGQSGNDSFEAYYDFHMRLVAPHVEIDGTELVISFVLAGSIGAGVHVFWVPISLSYSALSAPLPSARTRIVPTGGELLVIEDSIKPFTIVVVPDGDIPSQVLSWMTYFIVQGVIGTLTPLIVSFLSGIRFTSLRIPTYQESIDGVVVTMTPTNLSVDNVGGYIALTGSLQFS